MALPDLDLQSAQRVLNNYFSPDYSPKSANAARIKIEMYHNEKSDILPRSPLKLVEIYWALQILTCLGMGSSHRMDIKREDRRFGQEVRKKRTGSRRG